MNQSTSRYSFRRILDTPGDEHTQYVLSSSRHAGLLRFLHDNVDNIGDCHALDIGCGAGIISHGLASVCQQVTGIDGNSDNVAMAESQAHQDEIGNAVFKCGSATNLPLEDNSVDLIIINGVLEWVGLNDQGRDPTQLQQLALREARRVLRDGGILYLAIENRWHPGTLIRDPHTQLLAVNALPRPLANTVSRSLTGNPFQAYIYGRRSYVGLLRQAGFGDVREFVPFPSYQYPATFIRLGSRAVTLQDIEAMDLAKVRETRKQSGRQDDIDHALKRLRQKASLGLLGALTHDLSFLVKK